MRYLGIDPGLRITGYGCLEVPAGGLRAGTAPAIIEAGVFRLGKGEREPGKTVASVSARLMELDADLRDLFERVKPEVVAVEALFAHPKHPATAIVMAHARGVILLNVRRAGLALVELRPREVKKSLTMWGAAGKDQMQRAVQARFGLAEPPSPPDVADAIAIALCAAERALPGT
jgi:crossover junction endodeoxyribonuclease RuvC